MSAYIVCEQDSRENGCFFSIKTFPHIEELDEVIVFTEDGRGIVSVPVTIKFSVLKAMVSTVERAHKEINRIETEEGCDK